MLSGRAYIIHSKRGKLIASTAPSNYLSGRPPSLIGNKPSERLPPKLGRTASHQEATINFDKLHDVPRSVPMYTRVLYNIAIIIFDPPHS